MSTDFTVHLDRVFEGPMDLLLHLVKEQEVEIHEINITQVIDRYLQYMQHLEQLDIEVAGEFLVLAATLMAIKSRSLLPREEVELGDDLDPEDELIQRLIEYRRFKGASDDLEDRWARRLREHRRGFQGEVAQNAPERILDMGELSAFDLLAAFSRLMRETLANRTQHIKGDPRPLRWYVREVGRMLHSRGQLRLSDLVQSATGESSREAVIGVFCALLELMKLGVVTADQNANGEEVEVKLAREAIDLDDLIGASRFMDEEDVEDGLEDPPAPEVAPEVAAAEAPLPQAETSLNGDPESPTENTEPDPVTG